MRYAKYTSYKTHTKKIICVYLCVYVAMLLLMRLMREGLHFYNKSLEIYELIKRTGLLFFCSSEVCSRDG